MKLRSKTKLSNTNSLRDDIRPQRLYFYSTFHPRIVAQGALHQINQNSKTSDKSNNENSKSIKTTIQVIIKIVNV